MRTPKNNRRFRNMTPAERRAFSQITPQTMIRPVVSDAIANCVHSDADAVLYKGKLYPFYGCRLDGVGQIYMGIPHCVRLIHGGLCRHYRDHDGPDGAATDETLPF